MRVPVAERMSPDMFGLTFHVSTPLQDQFGIITPSSLFYVATHRGSYVPEIDPAEHRLMIHGMVDRPLILTMDELKRLPFVTRVHFIECAGNRAQPRHKTVQETHGLTSCAEWTGVPLSLLLREAGVQSGASWIVAEGAEEVKGASSLPLAKVMDDGLVAYGMNGEPLRSAAGFPPAADRAGLRRDSSDQVSAPHQGGGPLLHDLRRLRPHQCGSEGGRIGPPDWTEIGDHLPIWRTAAARRRILRNRWPRVVRRGCDSQSRDLH